MSISQSAFEPGESAIRVAEQLMKHGQYDGFSLHQLDKRRAQRAGRTLFRVCDTGHPAVYFDREVESNIYQVRNRSNQDPLNFPIKVNNRLANLLSMSERGDGRPVQGMQDVFQIMVDELRGYTDRLAEVWVTDLTAVNRELARLGLDALDPGDEMTPLTSE